MTSSEKFTREDLVRAVSDLGMLPYFPQESRASVMTLLAGMCPHKEALEWLVTEAVNHVGTWPGPAELRGLLCTKYDAADGVDRWCSLPGYSAEDCESRHFDQHQQFKAEGYIAEGNRELIRLLSIANTVEAPNGN